MTAPVETDTSTNVKKKNKPKKKKSQDKAEAAATKHKKVDTGSTTDPTIQSAVPTSGVSSDEGMGWLFPAMLVAVTAAAIGFTVGRRRSGSSRPS